MISQYNGFSFQTWYSSQIIPSLFIVEAIMPQNVYFGTINLISACAFISVKNCYFQSKKYKMLICLPPETTTNPIITATWNFSAKANSAERHWVAAFRALWIKNKKTTARKKGSKKGLQNLGAARCNWYMHASLVPSHTRCVPRPLHLCWTSNCCCYMHYNK